MSHIIDPASLDMMARVSRVSSSRRRDSGFSHGNDHSSPSYKGGATPEIHLSRVDADCAVLEAAKPHGRDVPQAPPIALTDPRWAGLVVHSLAIGIVSTVLPLTVFPFLTAYLNMEGTQTLSARTLLGMPWILRPLFRIVMDATPLVCGQRHRPYVVLGWLIAFLSLGAIYFIEIPEPYFQDVSFRGTPLDDMTAEQLATLNRDAPRNGAIYVLLMTVATAGYVLADVAADALIAETAQRHFPPPSPDQGESPFVPRVTMQRYIAMLLSFLFMGFGMSGWHYGGDFDFTLSFNELMLITGIFASLPVPFAWLMIEEGEADPSGRPSLSVSVKRLWALFQNRTVAYVIACRFVGGVFGGVSATPVNPIALYWAGVQPLNDNVVSFVATGAVLALVVVADKRGWAINYRLAILGANVVVLALDCGATMFTIWGVVRSQWLWIGLPVMEALPSALDFVILTTLLSEIAEPGAEQELARALLAAVAFLATPVALTLTKFIDARFDLRNQDLMRDTTHVRVHATAAFLIAYASQLLSLAWLVALPRDGDAARAWQRRQKSPSSKRAGALLAALLALSLAWSVAVHVLSVVDATSCLRVAGGRGCGDEAPH